MPKFAFFGIQSLVYPGRDHVFNTDEPGVRARRVVQDALSNIFVDVSTVMVGF